MNTNKYINLEAQRVSLIHKLSKFSMNRMNYSVSENSWSIHQVLTHIVLSEDTIIQNAISNLKENKTKVLSWKTKFKLLFFRLSLVLNYKYKSPKVVNPTFVGEIDFDTLLNLWEYNRAQLEEVASYSKKELTKGIFHHPKIGYISFDQMISFLGIHYNHHLKQINFLVEFNPSTDEVTLAV